MKRFLLSALLGATAALPISAPTASAATVQVSAFQNSSSGGIGASAALIGFRKDLALASAIPSAWAAALSMAGTGFRRNFSCLKALAMALAGPLRVPLPPKA